MLSSIYRRHANVVPVMAKGVAELRRELIREQSLLQEKPEIHQFLDGFYLSRIGIRILVGECCCLVAATLTVEFAMKASSEELDKRMCFARSLTCGVSLFILCLPTWLAPCFLLQLFQCCCLQGSTLH